MQYLFNEIDNILAITDPNIIPINIVVLLQVYNPNGVLLYESPNWDLSTPIPSGGHFDDTIRTVSIGTRQYGFLPKNPVTGLSVEGIYTFNYKTYDKTSGLDPVPYTPSQEKVIYEYSRTVQSVSIVQSCNTKTVTFIDTTDYVQSHTNTGISTPIVSYSTELINETTGLISTSKDPYISITNGSNGSYYGTTTPQLEYDFSSTNILFKDYSVKDRFPKKSETIVYNCACQTAYCKAVSIAQCLYKDYKQEANFQKQQILKEKWEFALLMSMMIKGDCDCVKGNYAEYLADIGDCNCGCND